MASATEEREHLTTAQGGGEPWVPQGRGSDNGLARVQLKIGGMHCSFCVGTIEKALQRRSGVERVSVSLAHEEGLVEYRPERIDPLEIVETLRAVGYTVRDPRKVRSFEEQEAELRSERDRFLIALGFTVVSLILMVFKWTGGMPSFASSAGSSSSARG